MQLQPTSVSTVTTQLSSLTIDDSRFTDRHAQFTTDHSPFHTAEAQTTFLMFASGDEAALGWMYNRFYGPLIRYGCSRPDDSVELATLIRRLSFGSGRSRYYLPVARLSGLLHGSVLELCRNLPAVTSGLEP